MRILILGADGYLGWPTAMHFAAQGHEVIAVDNYLRRLIAQQTSSEPLFETPNLDDRAKLFKAEHGKSIDVEIGDLADLRWCDNLFAKHKPDVVVHYAEQPSAPYSMRGLDEAEMTMKNNLGVTFNVIWGMLNHCPDAHLVKLGTMGEYGTPNIDIEEGWIDVEHKGRSQKFLYPRQAGSLYHTTKVLDTDLLWFYVRLYGLRVTDLMQGPVYGLETAEAEANECLMPNFHYDDIFGTVVNRFLVQAIAGVPLTVYGKGGQTRGYLNLKDTLNCVDLASNNAADKGELRIFNQFTEQFSVNELADRVHAAGKRVGLDVKVKSIPNPRKELEDHYYNAKSTGLLELGLKPNFMTEDVLVRMLETIMSHKDRIDESKILPRVKWNG
ncbi:NAD-dependent epimerase/dehydratase family protein [Hyphobacterium sp. CCMP332]|uniref:NAD-dependent epimerase/dehydratase family protein n=1 Tax=Hyphobacterium sp. CCMP332 TaxID=2749086 RepID=UPI00164FE0E4|nr:NAD-dependent epimerase/dehydratase family protein [Hyphobacterium sp. CCMP332]QNL17881.1 NAD-dependent epimerase/dehydratase family protein [Hyphobacterium sp. CCMP332]